MPPAELGRRGSAGRRPVAGLAEAVAGLVEAADALVATIEKVPDDARATVFAKDRLRVQGSSCFAGAGPRSFTVRPDGSGRGWVVRIGADGAVETSRVAGDADGDGWDEVLTL